jgi:hypothetical protein
MPGPTTHKYSCLPYLHGIFCYIQALKILYIEASTLSSKARFLDQVCDNLTSNFNKRFAIVDLGIYVRVKLKRNGNSNTIICPWLIISKNAILTMASIWGTRIF